MLFTWQKKNTRLTNYSGYKKTSMDLVGPAHGKLCLSSDASNFSTKHVTLTFNLSCNTEAATPVLAVETLRNKLNAISVLWPAAPPQPHLQTSHAGTDPTSVDRNTLPCYLSSSRSLSHFSCSMSQLLVLHSLCQFNIVIEAGERAKHFLLSACGIRAF